MNQELAHAFEQIADLLEITGGDAFRITSYRRVSRIIRDLADDIRVLNEAGVLREVSGIGKATAAKIEEYLETGEISLLNELKEQVPAGLPELLKIPGMGPKKVALVHQALKVKDLEDLKAAIESGRLAELPGMGAASVKRIAEGITFLESSHGRTPLGVARPIAIALKDMVAALPGVSQAEVAGSLRRGLETIGDIDILCAADDGEATVRAFIEQAQPRQVLASGETKGSIIVGLGDERGIQVDLRVVPAESFGAALQYFTGSKEHNVRVREMARERGWKLNEWGLFDGDTTLAGKTEVEIYAKLDLPLMPPEVREDRFEFDKGQDFDALIDLKSIRGDLHMHTTASDGKYSIEDMAKAAKKLGYAYIAICDHSKSSVIANGLSIERMQDHIRAIRDANKKVSGIEILVGTECDILSDGSLDYPDEILAECDLVVASIHAAMEKGKATPTERTLAAIENRYVTIIGHPSGRLLNRRPAMELDMARIVEAAAKSHTALEINASWQRLDLKDVHARQAALAGVMLAISTDAHATGELERVHYGVTTASRAGIRKDQVLNVMNLADLRMWIAHKRK